MVLGLMGFQIGQRAYATPSHSSTQWPVVVNTLKYYTYGILFQNRPLICLIPTYLLPAVTETWRLTSPTSNLAHTSTAHVSIKLPHLVFSVSKQWPSPSYWKAAPTITSCMLFPHKERSWALVLCTCIFMCVFMYVHRWFFRELLESRFL